MTHPVITPLKKKKEPPVASNDELAQFDRPRHRISMWLSIGFTVASVLLYMSLYGVIPRYEQALSGLAEGKLVMMKVILNIYQIYLGVFILISLALFIVYFIRTKYFTYPQNILFSILVVNFLIAALLFSISFVGVKIPV